MLPFHLNFRSFWVPYVHVLVTSCRDTDKQIFLRSILDMSFPFCENSFRKKEPFILQQTYGMCWFNPFKFITRRWSSSSLEMLTKKMNWNIDFEMIYLVFYHPLLTTVAIHGGGDIWKGSKTRKGVWFLFKISTITELLVRLDQFLVNNASCPDIGAFTKYSRDINLFITGYTHAYM